MPIWTGVLSPQPAGEVLREFSIPELLHLKSVCVSADADLSNDSQRVCGLNAEASQAWIRLAVPREHAYKLSNP